MFKPLSIVGAASFLAGLAMIAGSGYHLSEFSVFLFGLAVILLVVALTQWIRNNEICKYLDAFEFLGEQVYRSYLLTQNSPENVRLQTAWFNKVDTFFKEKKITERGSFKAARTTRTLNLPPGFAIDATEAVTQILGRQELLRELKSKLRN